MQWSCVGDGAYDTKGCHEAIAKRGAQAIIPIRKYAKRWKDQGPGAKGRNAVLAATRRLGRKIWKIARRCVSGAIRFERRDGLDPEVASPVNLVRMRENGPLAVNAAIRIVPADGSASDELRATLRRCGQSKNNPFCDQFHVAARFDASGEAQTRLSAQLESRDGLLVVTPLRDGPLDLRGAAEVITGTGRTVDRTMGARLCRCGQSRDKPFCDGSHRAAGFVAEERGA